MPRIGYLEQGEECLYKHLQASAAPVSAPVTGDTQRHAATSDDGQIGPWRWSWYTGSYEVE